MWQALERAPWRLRAQRHRERKVAILEARKERLQVEWNAIEAQKATYAASLLTSGGVASDVIGDDAVDAAREELDPEAICGPRP